MQLLMWLCTLLWLERGSAAYREHENCEVRHHVEVAALDGAHHIIRVWRDATNAHHLLTINIVGEQQQQQQQQQIQHHRSRLSEAKQHREGNTDTNVLVISVVDDRRHIESIPTTRHIKFGWNFLKIKLLDLSTLAVYSDGEFRNLFSSKEIKKYYNESLSWSAEKIRFSGSNITVDCYKRFLQWHISLPHEALIPLTHNVSRSTQVIDMFSATPYTADLRIIPGHVKLNLGWDETQQRVTANSSVALPARRVAAISLNCNQQHQGYVCYVRSQHSLLLTLRLPQAPQYLLAKVGQLTHGYRVRLRAKPLLTTAPTQLQRTGEDVTCPPSGGGGGGGGFTSALVTLLVLALLFFVLVLVLKLLFGARLVFKPTVKWLSWVTAHGTSSETGPRPGDCEMMPWPQQEPNEEDSLLQHHARHSEILTPVQQQSVELWSAVSKASVPVIQRLMEEDADPSTLAPGHDTTPLQEAHLMRNRHVLRALGQADLPPCSQLIRTLVPILQTRIENLFTSTPQLPQDLDDALRVSGMSDSVTDVRGRGLLHHAVSVNSVTGHPRWGAELVQHLLQKRTVFCNAVDFQGNTPLHCLASHALGRGSDAEVSQMWVQGAEMLLASGADPTILNTQDFTPLDIAQFNGNDKLVELFAKHQPKKQRRSHLFNTAADAEIEKCKGLLSAVQSSASSTLAEFNSSVRVDPVLAGGCPLAASVMQEDYHVMCLLLSAGASSCAGRGLTALQVSHSMPGLPAVFAALLRIDCHNRLMHASARASQELVGPIKKMADDIMENGPNEMKEASDHHPSVDTAVDVDHQRKLRIAMTTLTNFAVQELTFPCQLYCLENLISYTITGMPNPVEQAILAGKKKVVITLCKDTHLSPYPNMICGEEPPEVADSLLLNDIKLLENFLTARADSDDILFNFCYEMKINGRTSKSPPSSVWIAIAKLGLQVIYHRLIKHHYLDANEIVNTNLGFTMLHYAAAHGRVPMIQSLLKMSYDPNLSAAYGATSYHLSVVRHHPDAIRCFQNWATVEGVELDKTLLQLNLRALTAACNKRFDSLEVLSKYDYTEVLCEKNSARKRMALLKKRFKKLNKNNLVKLVEINDRRLEDNSKYLTTIKLEIQHFFDKVAFDFPAINCTVIEDPSTLNIHSLNIEYEFCIEINKQNFLRNKFVDNCNIVTMIKESFQAAVENSILGPHKAHVCLNANTTFTYPYFKPHEAGAVIYMLKYSGDTIYRIKNVLFLKTEESSTSTNLHNTTNFNKVTFANANIERTQVSLNQKSVILKACLTMCSGLSDKLCCLNYSNTRLAREHSQLSPRMPKINLRLIETILVQVLPCVQFNKPFDNNQSQHPTKHSSHQDDDKDKNIRAKSTDSSTILLLNDCNYLEGGDIDKTELPRKEVPDHNEDPGNLYDDVLLVIETALDQCGSGTLLTETMFATAHPRELDTVKQTFMAVQNFIKNLR